MQSLFLSFEEDVTIFSSSFVWIRGMWHTENAVNKIIHFQPFCLHFSRICVHLQCYLFTVITISQVQRIQKKMRAVVKYEADLKRGWWWCFCPQGLDTHCVFL